MMHENEEVETEEMEHEPSNRGTTGQSLHDKEMHYDPETGKRVGGEDLGLPPEAQTPQV